MAADAELQPLRKKVPTKVSSAFSLDFSLEHFPNHNLGVVPKLKTVVLLGGGIKDKFRDVRIAVVFGTSNRSILGTAHGALAELQAG